MENLLPRLRIRLDSTVRGVVNEVLFGVGLDLGVSIATPIKGRLRQQAAETELANRTQGIDAAVKAGLASNSFKIYRQNL